MEDLREKLQMLTVMNDGLIEQKAREGRVQNQESGQFNPFCCYGCGDTNHFF